MSRPIPPAVKAAHEMWLATNLAQRERNRHLYAREIDAGRVAWQCGQHCDHDPTDLGGCNHQGDYLYGDDAIRLLHHASPAGLPDLPPWPPPPRQAEATLMAASLPTLPPWPSTW